MNRIIPTCLLLCILSQIARANPFFAFDNIANKGPGALTRKLDDLKQLGYDGLSWSGTDLLQIQAVIAAAEERGLRLHALYVSFPLRQGKLQVPENLTPLLQALEGHGTILWIHIQSQTHRPSDPAGDAIAVPALRETADRAARHGVRIALYPHAGFWIETVADALRVARKVDRPNLGITFNLCHALKTGDELRLPHLLREARPHLFVVSLNGADAGAGRAGRWEQLIRPVGEGTFDVSIILRELQSIGFTGPIGFQGYAIEGERVDILRRSITGWRALKGRVMTPAGEEKGRGE